MIRLWESLVAPSRDLGDAGDRAEARLLSALLFSLVVFGLFSGVVQLLTVREFLGVFVSICTALSALVSAYALSRTRHYRLAVLLATLIIVAACARVGVDHPDDQVWWAFMIPAVVLAAVFLSTEKPPRTMR